MKARLHFNNNLALHTLALPSLVSVGKHLDISYLDELETLDLSSLIAVEDYLIIRDNP